MGRNTRVGLVVAVLVAVLASLAPAFATRSSAALVTIDTNAEVTVSNGSETDLERLRLALSRFSEADMVLPPLTVVFSDDRSHCKGYDGLFQPRFSPWKITICSTEKDYVFEHELAHAWLAHNLTGADRRAFVDRYEYTVWQDPDVPPHKWAEEAAAVIIHDAMAGIPLPATLDAEDHARLEAFEFLTGNPDPRLET